jgi:hypothetical protein
MRAHGIPCPRCGGIFPLTTIGVGIECPYCAHRFSLGADAVAELERYQAEVHAALGQAEVEQREIARWQRRTASTGSPWFGLLWIAAVIIVPTLGSFALKIAAEQVEIQDWVGRSLSLALVFAPLALLTGASLVLGVQAKRSLDRASVGASRVACPSCGAPNDLGAGQALASCRYCQAALVPSRTVMMQAIGAARAAQRSAEIARYRTERSAAQLNLRRSAPSATPYIALGAPLPIILTATIVFGVSAVRGDPDAPLPVVGGMLTLLGLNLCAMVGVYAWRSFRRARFTQAIAALARQFGGRILPGMPDVVAWLNAHWAAPYDVQYMSSGPHHVAAAIDAAGYAVLVDVDTHAADPERCPPRAHIVLAALIPASNQRPRSATAQASEDWLSRAGFSVTVEASGLFARAAGKTVLGLGKNPESIHMLSTVITTLAGLARELNGVPVEPLP